MFEYEEQIESLINALSLSEDTSDVKELQKQLQVTCNQLKILQEKNKLIKTELLRLRKNINELNKDKIRARKQRNELSFERDLALSNIKSVKNELSSVQNELKLKNILLVKIENDRRKMQIHLKTSNDQTNSLQLKKISIKRNKDNNIKHETKNVKFVKNVNNEKQENNGNKLLNNGLELTHNKLNCSQESDKTLTLQRLLLTKVKELAEKDIFIEQCETKCFEMKQQINRLRKAKHIAEELTITRHKLNVKTNQIIGLRSELMKYKEKMAFYMKENQTLKQKVKEFYEQKRDLTTNLNTK